MRTIIIIRNAAREDFGGGEKVPVNISKAATQLDPNLNIVILSGSNKLLNYANDQNVKAKKSWWWPKQNWNGKNVFLFPAYIVWQMVLIVYYLYLFLRLKPSIIHLQSKDDFISGTIAGRLLGKKILWSDYADLKHILLNTHIWYKNPVGKLVYLASFLVHKIFVVSNEDLSLIFKNVKSIGFQNKCEVLYYGANDTYKAQTKLKKFTYVYSGRLVKDKGVGELINAFHVVSKNHQNTHLRIIGDGPDKNKFIKMAETNKNIEFMGFKSNPLEYIAQSHVFMLPTYHEGFSIALVEACMLGMPIIATRVGGNPEIIDNGKNGLLVKPMDKDQLEAAMEDLLKNDKLRTTLGSSARKRFLKELNFKPIISKRLLPIYRGDK